MRSAAVFGLCLFPLLAAGLSGRASGQCILANPSFEIAGQGGASFGGWSQFGNVGAVTGAVHGNWAARASGPGGAWAVSGFWQAQTAAPGERWTVTGHVRHPSTKPLTGQCGALVNVEWRDAADQLISYDSFTVATAASPVDEFLPFSVQSQPAPAGTASIHLLLGVLQSPGAPSPDAHFDQITIASDGQPSLDELQWSDFPGGRSLDFAGRSWRVKGPGYYGPGPNVFSDDPECVWVDGQGRLHLTLAQRAGGWTSTEVVAEAALGYGDYIVTTAGRLDLLDRFAICGLFLWQYGPCWDDAYLWWNPYNEVDIEYGRWGDPEREIGQFVAQPWDWPGNLEHFDFAIAEGERISHAMRWLSDRVEYRVWRGGADEEASAPLVASWTYSGPHVPRPEQPRLHLNLWKHPGGTPAAAQEVIVESVHFLPAGGGSAMDGDPAHELASGPAGWLAPAAPNPFNPATTLRFTLVRETSIALEVFDLAGRQLRSLASGPWPAGNHALSWDGRDAMGRALPSGVYLVHLRGAGCADSQRVVLIK